MKNWARRRHTTVTVTKPQIRLEASKILQRQNVWKTLVKNLYLNLFNTIANMLSLYDFELQIPTFATARLSRRKTRITKKKKTNDFHFHWLFPPEFVKLYQENPQMANITTANRQTTCQIDSHQTKFFFKKLRVDGASCFVPFFVLTLVTPFNIDHVHTW